MNDWTLEYEGAGIHQGAEVAFGGPRSGYIMREMPVIDSPEFTLDDALAPRSDGVLFGEDTRGGTTVPLDLTVDGRNEAEGRTLLGALARAWRSDALRTTPGAVATLTAHSGRRAFGRPRRFSADGRFSHLGRYDVTADFKTVDDLWYGPEGGVDVSIAGAVGGGLVAPLAAPLATTRSSNRARSFVVGGDLPTWAVIEISGPITNPEVEIPGVLLEQFRTTLLFDQTIRLDARPWSRSVLRGTGNVSGLRTRASTPLVAALIPPGQHQLILRGTSATGTATARLRWADAFPTY